VDLGASLNAVAKRKKSHGCPCQELNPDRPACEHVCSLGSLSVEVVQPRVSDIIKGLAVQLPK